MSHRSSWALLTRCASVLKSLAVSGFILPVARVARRIVLARVCGSSVRGLLC